MSRNKISLGKPPSHLLQQAPLPEQKEAKEKIIFDRRQAKSSTPSSLVAGYFKERIMKEIIGTILFVAVAIAFIYFWFYVDKKCEEIIYNRGYEQGRIVGHTAGYAAGYSYIKSVAELQQQAGIEPNDCDGFWGPKTEKAYNRAYGNQEAVKCFKRMSR